MRDRPLRRQQEGPSLASGKGGNETDGDCPLVIMPGHADREGADREPSGETDRQQGTRCAIAARCHHSRMGDAADDGETYESSEASHRGRRQVAPP
jgi:hypothetical protein